jgi:hypothetical protein
VRRALWTAAALGAAAALAAGVVPASASFSAHSPWHVVYRHQFAARSYSRFAAMTAAGTGEMWAVGGYGVAGNGLAGAALWKNHRWRVTPVPQPLTLGTITAASADSASNAWAVAANGYVIRWNGSHWRIAKRLAEPQTGLPGDVPTGVLAVSARNVWVFYATWRDRPRGALHGGALHDLNGIWKQVTGPGRTIIAASEARPSELWAIGGSDISHAGLLRYAAGRWRPVTAPALAGLTFAGVLARRNGPVWALGWPSSGTGAGVLLKLSGGHWSGNSLPASIQPGPAIDGPTALASDGHGGVWIAAPAFYPHAGHLLHFANGSWQQIDLGANVNADSVLAVPGSKALCAAGAAAHYQQSYSTALVWSTGRAC